MTRSVEIFVEDSVSHIRLNRPAAFNAFDLTLATELGDALADAARDPRVRAVVLCGAGRAFCAGGDLKWVASQPGGAGAALHRLAGQLHLGIVEIRRMAKPVVAAINGVAAGAGFSLALACDYRVMERSATLRQVYTSNGLCIDGGGTFLLPRLVGLARAMEIAGFDEPIPAERALAWGLATKVVEDATAVAEARGLASRIASRSLHSFGLAKRLLDSSFEQPLEAQLEREREGISACGDHADGREGIAAFLEKRPPRFA